MRKILSLALCLMMVLSCIPAFAEEDVAVKTGLSFVVTLGKSKDGQSQADMALTAVAVDDNGVITACVIDCIQGKVKFDETGKITSDLTAKVLSKNELGDDYGMRKASEIKKEWNEQAAAFAAYCVGKTVEELSGMAVNENGVSVDLATSCTLTVNEFLPGVVDAVNNAAHRGAKKSDVLKMTQLSSISKSKDATAEADGQTQVYTHVGMFTLNGDVITSAYIDAVQANVKFNAEGKVTSDTTVTVATKNTLKDDYGMRAVSSIQKEWFEQAAAFCEFITGKTLNDAIASASTDAVSGCTIKTGDFIKLIGKVAQ